MERAPLPPHERTWRHPSELGPTAPAIGADGRAEHGLATWLATGTLAVIVVAALVVTITPRRSVGPVALTSTTLPATAQNFRSAMSTVTTNEMQAGVVALANSVRTARIDRFTAVPTGIASAPGRVIDDVAVDQIAANDVMLPDLTDEVKVISHDFIYSVKWRDVAHLTDVADAVVVTDAGAVIAVITDGRLVVASDSYGGVAIESSAKVSTSIDVVDRVNPDD